MARLIKFAFHIFSKSIEGPFWENRIIEGQKAAKELLEPIFELKKYRVAVHMGLNYYKDSKEIHSSCRSTLLIFNPFA